MHTKLSDIIGPELSNALAAISFDVPTERDGLRLVHLKNNHFGQDRLLCSELPADAMIPHCYEGDWETPFPGYAPEPRRRSPVWDGGILERFGRCVAIYA